MDAVYISHPGAVRENNEDAVFCDSAAGLFVIADGIGGKEAGEIASATAVRIVAEKSWQNPNDPPGEMLREAFYEANNFLYKKGARPELHGMGTTLTAAICRGDRVTVVHVGDTRVYLVNRQGITQLTEDHSLVAQMRREGRLTAEEAKNHPHRNILLRAVGQEALVEVDELETEWHSGDYLLLCSDGLYNLVEDEEMQEMILRTAQLETAATYLAEAAYNRGGYDNISLVIVAHD
ncbi:MAG: Stp1/IreP family PP2C-type Ser/Thr phosphatase [Firmicutes bacterium]|nr:Stp1/IreP family PP2C-type Ser/Thr phosphatase [Bacillota bacterium]